MAEVQTGVNAYTVKKSANKKKETCHSRVVSFVSRPANRATSNTLTVEKQQQKQRVRICQSKRAPEYNTGNVNSLNY